MPFYCLYAIPETDAFSKYQEIISDFNDSEKIAYKINDIPHFTMMFGPKLQDGEDEVTSVEGARQILNGVVPKCDSELVFSRFDIFEQENVNTLVAVYQSSELKNLQVRLSEKVKGLEECGAYALPPLLHISLAHIKKDVTVDYSGIDVPLTIKISHFELISAVTDTRIKL